MGYPDGKLWVRRHELAFGKSYETAEWKGGDYGLISNDFLWDLEIRPQAGQIIILHGYKLRLIEYMPVYDGWLAVRDNWLSLPRWYRYWLSNVIKGIYYRVVLTLYVWELAERNEFNPPSWRDIKIFKRLP